MKPSMTPSPELIRDIRNAAPQVNYLTNLIRETYIVEAAYQAGADAELEACCGWIESKSELGVLSFTPEVRAKFRCQVSDQLRAARRPKPPSLKQQALQQLQAMEQAGALDCNIDTIRQAIESLPDADS